MENKLQNQQNPASVELMNDIYADFYVGNRFTSLQEEYRLVQRYFPELDSVALVRNLAKVYSPQKMHYLLRANEKANKKPENNLRNGIINIFLYRMNYANYRRGDILSEKKIYQR